VVILDKAFDITASLKADVSQNVLRSDDQTSTTKLDNELSGNAVTQSSQGEVVLTDVKYQELGVHSPLWSCYEAKGACTLLSVKHNVKEKKELACP